MNKDILRTTILVSLAAGPQHGYGMVADITELSEGRFTPAVGSLYRAIDLLIRDGFIADHSTEVVDGRYRRYYHLTPLGRAELAETTGVMAAVISAAARRLGAPPAAPTAPAGA